MSDSKSQPYTTVRIATSKGPLAQIWLAANMSNIPRNSILQTSIPESAGEIAKASGCSSVGDDAAQVEHITLHTSGDLLQGIVRVYSKQAVFLLNDIKETLTKISSLFKSNQRINVTLSKTNTIARVDQLILEDAVTEREVLVTPDLNFLFESRPKQSGLMGKEDMMQRKVQGAAPWDTSLEVGRRFNPDESLEYHQSSALDLDFDIENGQEEASSKTWEEGTRQTLQDSRNQLSPRKSHEPESFIAEDDFPLDDPHNWDLGISENDVQQQHADNESNMSVEVGRRINDNAGDGVIDFGFDLDIDKEAVEQQTDLNSSNLKDIKQSTPTGSTKINERNSVPRGMLNITQIVVDHDTEISDVEIKAIVRPTRREEVAAKDLKMTRKRLLNDFHQSVDYLPKNTLENLFSYQTSKRPRLPLGNKVGEPEMDISLGIDEELLQSSIIADGQTSPYAEDSDHFVPIESDMEQPPIDEDTQTSIRAAGEPHNENLELPHTQQAPRIRLVNGELVSKATVNMAELLKTEFTDKNSISFHTLLDAKHQAEANEDDNSKSITKSEACEGFFEMLSLATVGCIELSQPVAFEDINIKTRAPLYEKFITA